MNEFRNLHIGVLALQGDYARHCHQLRLLGAQCSEIRLPRHLETVDGLIWPGGESTTMNILLDRFNLRHAIAEFAGRKPVWGTCAGMIMIAKNIIGNLSRVQTLGLMDIDIERNSYGRQIFSFDETITARLDSRVVKLNGSFIRAPRVIRTGETVEILAEFHGDPVLLRENNLLASSFHTELDNDTTLLAYFLTNFLLATTDS